MRFTVRAPASSANLGPGFDTLALALDLWNEIEVDLVGEPGAIVIEGPEAALLDGRENLSLKAMRRLAGEHRRTLPPMAVTVRTVVPVARGLGSSAAAIAAGLVAGNEMLGLNLTTRDLYDLAWQMEGHGDNVGAALYGGAVMAVPRVREPIQLLRDGVPAVTAVVFIPEVTSATWAARAALPNTIPHPDAAFNVASAAGLAVGLLTHDLTLIGASMHDRLHEPYRARLFPHLEPLTIAARRGGAIGAALSGAGPSILTLARPEDVPAVTTVLQEAAAGVGVTGEVRVLPPVLTGAHLVETQPAAVQAGSHRHQLAIRTATGAG
jgi:homoserine kinase